MPDWLQTSLGITQRANVAHFFVDKLKLKSLHGVFSFITLKNVIVQHIFCTIFITTNFQQQRTLKKNLMETRQLQQHSPDFNIFIQIFFQHIFNKCM